ncbi:Lsr2 family protein [Geodermatophilus obscurus]|uniref:Lsr2 protein n=1 Tax=Geodermatophilus obscurus (strain ATCC 25078 / DSM 43160 / JCM 3152 / CCUG 61914 / KCC A-0152 / KCTC 9177 / NBRC 13315 / NRRL B-3577 / G-20) TaxID=526225 RepID=D2S867_GEOOG|nr:Lsr2 family protein [Geodermatophilus obscurus]ADB73489.1 hypothetical protein Gobs_0719 [Geodermatophilus obscurus DSM 43160]
MTDFKVGDIAEVRDNGPILKAGEQFTVTEVLGQRIRINRPGASNLFSALIFRKVGGDPVRQPAVAATSLEALISQGLESPVKTVQRAAERARDAVQRFVEVEREERGKAALHAEVAQLERQLREAKAKLKGRPAEAPAPKASVADMRAWCVDRSIPVPVKGRLPREAVGAYERAHA